MSILVAAAGLLAVPEIVPDTESYPSKSLRSAESAAALIEFVIDPDGDQISCTTLAAFGSEGLANDICKLQRKAQFEQAFSAAGRPTYGVVRAFIKYAIPFFEHRKAGQSENIMSLVAPGITHEVIGSVLIRGDRLPSPNALKNLEKTRIVALPDVTFDVKSLPGSDDDFIDERVTVEIDDRSQVTACTPLSRTDSDQVVSDYAKAACENVIGMHMPDALTIDQRPVEHVRHLEVRFAIARDK
ncbi:hypothetical protein [Croceicoccus naphthovorans]|uniref:Uncharacterized protein n=1 Tax=Croceicoccus naphthovorans TaxID=1348774 RepID=A0A0G3XHB2_9SPHN|nr:hypothetical protein [Croceicoccus naphthovorans]AKM09763.1 hypothetical protein AB433_06855 [Croceicoccus naphthovorans]MBB3990691.1 hypothetical protein [Croceicoccus naphthovorans]